MSRFENKGMIMKRTYRTLCRNIDFGLLRGEYKRAAYLIVFFLIQLFTLAMIQNCRAELKIHFMDVGQGDAVLIQCDGESILLDAGPMEAGDKVNAYLKKQGIERLTAVIASHEHDDHLAGMPAALRGMSVDTVYTPQSVPITWWFENILPVLAQQGMNVIRTPGEGSVPLGEATVSFLGRLTQSEIPNNLCDVLRVDYENTSVLLMADLEGEGESYLLNSGANLKADVLKIGHHGGNTSTTDAFLKAVDPQIAVISVGTENKHGHPHSETLKKLSKHNIVVYRTDEFGDILLISDGNTWRTEVSKAR